MLKEQIMVVICVVLTHVLISIVMPEVREIPNYTSVMIITGVLFWLWVTGLMFGVRYSGNKEVKHTDGDEKGQNTIPYEFPDFDPETETLYLFKVHDYTTLLMGRYHEPTESYVVQRGDGKCFPYKYWRITEVTPYKLVEKEAKNGTYKRDGVRNKPYRKGS